MNTSIENIKSNAHSLFSFEEAVLKAYPETRVFLITPKGVTCLYSDSERSKGAGKHYKKLRNAEANFASFCKKSIYIALSNGDYKTAKIVNI